MGLGGCGNDDSDVSDGSYPDSYSETGSDAEATSDMLPPTAGGSASSAKRHDLNLRLSSALHALYKLDGRMLRIQNEMNALKKEIGNIKKEIGTSPSGGLPFEPCECSNECKMYDHAGGDAQCACGCHDEK
jgi:hypothetical protein